MVRLPVTLLMLALSGAKLEEDTSRVICLPQCCSASE